ncbi:putative ribonuclease H-like domain-containing protein [Tanacetum coccineum]
MAKSSSHNPSSPEITPKEEPVTLDKPKSPNPFLPADQIKFTFDEIAFTTKNEVALLYPSHLNSKYFREVSTSIGGIRGDVGINTFRNVLRAHYLPHASMYVSPPSITTTRPWFATIGYNGEIEAKGTLKKSFLPPRWRLLTGKIIQCLGRKIGGLDQISNKDATILYCLANGVKVDYAKLIWEDIIHKLNKKNREKALKPNQTEGPPFTDHMKSICNLDVLVDSKAPKPSSQTEETKASKSKTGQSEKETQSSSAKDKSPSHPLPPTPVVGEMHKEAQQATGHDASADSIAEADPVNSAPNDSIPSQQDLLKNTRSAFFTPDSPQDELIIVLDVHLLQSQKEKLEQQKAKAKEEVASLKAGPSYPDINQLTELLMDQSLEEEEDLSLMALQKIKSDAPIIEEYESDSEDEHVSQPTKEQEQPSFTSTNKQVKTPRETLHTARASWYDNVSYLIGMILRKAVPTNAAMKVNIVKPMVNRVRPANVFYKTHSPFSRSFINTTALRTKFSYQKVNTAEDYPHRALKHKGIVDSRCSRHMNGNKAYLAEYQDFNGGPVAFGGSKGYITGKGVLVADVKNLATVVNVSPIPHQGRIAAVQDSKSLDSCRFALWEEGHWNKMGFKPSGFFSFATYIGFHSLSKDVKKCFLYGKLMRAWYATLSTFLLKNGYRRGTIDKTLFIKKDKHDIILVQVYVDDIIFGSTKKSWCDEFEALMKSRFQMSSMGELTFFLGLQVKQKEDGIFISQDKYVAEILKKFDFVSVKTASTPIETQKPLVKDEEASDVDVHLYRSMIGSLMYLTASRPDIMFAVCACSRFQVTPKTSHLSAVKRIFRYLKGKPKLGLWYPRVSSFDLEAYSDSDYAGANLDRKSTTGGCQFLGRRLISWQCKKQTIVATSTTEAEYVAAANCCGQVLWIQNQMLDYGFNFMNTKIYIDNESTICIVKNPVYHSKTKHIAIRHHFIRDAYEKKLIQVLKIHTDDNVADLLTKAFDVSRFQFLVVTIGMINP